MKTTTTVTVTLTQEQVRTLKSALSALQIERNQWARGTVNSAAKAEAMMEVSRGSAEITDLLKLLIKA